MKKPKKLGKAFVGEPQPKPPKFLKKRGRPPIYTPALGIAVCDAVAGGIPLNNVLKQDGFPDRMTFNSWLLKDPEFFAMYMRARIALYDVWAEEILTISDDDSRDTVETGEGTKTDHEHIQRSRLRVDSRRWLLSKLRPTTYGDSQTIKHTGAVDTSPQSADELRAKARLLGISESDLFA